MKALTTIFTVLALGTFAINAAEKPKGEKAKKSPEEVFKAKDANADGKLSKEEFLKGAKPDKAAAMEEMFGKKDKDKSGDLTKEEFTSGGKKKKEAK